MIIFLNHRDRLFCDVFETPNDNNDYFTIITIIGPTINCSDASLKSNAGTDDNGDNDDVYGDLVDDNGDLVDDNGRPINSPPSGLYHAAHSENLQP